MFYRHRHNLSADGVIVEVHSCPEKAFSDGQQTLSFPEAESLYKKLRAVFALREEMAHIKHNIPETNG